MLSLQWRRNCPEPDRERRQNSPRPRQRIILPDVIDSCQHGRWPCKRHLRRPSGMVDEGRNHWLPATYAALPSPLPPASRVGNSLSDTPHTRGHSPGNSHSSSPFTIVPHPGELGDLPAPLYLELFHCFRCQRLGNYPASCSRPQVCGMRTGWHEMLQCLQKYLSKPYVLH